MLNTVMTIAALKVKLLLMTGAEPFASTSTAALKIKAAMNYALFGLLVFFQGGGGDLATMADSIQNILIQVSIVSIPVLIAVGFVMILFGGVNPQWKQRGIETIKWAAIGAIGLGIGVGALQAFIVSAGGLSGGGGS
jgi:hypothetical protein